MLFSHARLRARRLITAGIAGLLLASGAPDATAETLHIGARNCYDAFDTSIPNNVVTPGSWVVQHLTMHINGNIRNRCDPNSFVIDGTWTTGAVWEGGAHKGNGGPWWTDKWANGGWHTVAIGYWAPTGIGWHDMRAYILSSRSTFPSPSFYNGAARAWLEVVSAPTPPQNVRSAPSGVDRVLVQWDAPASDGGRGVHGYEIWRDGRVIRTVGAGERGIVDGPFPPGECHTYFVKAWNAVGFSGGSNQTVGCAAPDRTAPSVTGTASRAPDSGKWYNAPASVDWTATDPYPSSGTPTDPPNTPIDREGEDVVYTSGPSCDPARNCATGTFVASLDTTAPVVTPDVAPAESAPGWHNVDTTVAWTCADALSGVASCSSPQSVTEEGRHVLTGTGTDVAGNTGTTTVEVNLDRTVPTTTDDAATTWQAGDTLVTLTPTDNLSGVAATTYRLDGGPEQPGTEVPVAGHGTHTIEYRSADAAGNVEAVRTATVRIDEVAPTIDAVVSPPPNAAGWNSTEVTVSWQCDDADSGVASCSAPVTLTGEGDHVVTGTVTDAAGNTATATRLVRIDATGPTLVAVPDRSPDGNAGWYLAAVRVEWDCVDTGSGTATCPAGTTLAAEGEALTVTATATDVAGNETTATSPAYAVDLAAASASVDPPRVNGVGLPLARTVTGAASDTMSGVARVEVQFTPSNGGAPSAPIVATCTGCGSGAGARSVTWQVPGTALPRGSYAVQARAFDAAGHPAAWSAPVTMVIVG